MLAYYLVSFLGCGDLLHAQRGIYSLLGEEYNTLRIVYLCNDSVAIIQVRSLSARCTKHWRKWDFPKEMYWSLPEIQRRRFLLYYAYEFNFYQIAAMEPVSYTHLDVYKRQGRT